MTKGVLLVGVKNRSGLSLASATLMFKTKEEFVNEKCVVLLSGGVDSTVLLYSLIREYECYPLTIDYGQRHSKECIAARNVCEALNCNLLLRHKHLNFGVLRTLLPSSLTGKGEVPEGHYTEESMSSTVVPGRNLIFLAIAAGYAEGLGAQSVAYAAHSEDHYLYPDCRPEFVRAAQSVVYMSSGKRLSLLAPLLTTSKTDIVKLGAKLAVPFGSTWSCYEGGEVHCGKCGTCVERKEAFVKAGVPDPTEYEV